MKKKLLGLLCLLTLLFTIGCNKEEKTPDPTPTTTSTPTPTATSTPTPSPSPTPTPIPENLAMTNLKKLPTAYSSLALLEPAANMDYSQGLGYDIDMELTVNEALLEALEITDLKNISLKGTMDMKDTLAADFVLFLNETEVIEADVLSDFKTAMFNLPKYSANYASVSFEEMLGLPAEELPAWNLETFPSNQEIYAFVEDSLTDLVNCFEPQPGIEENLTIGTGEYTMTGEKHTAIVSREKLMAWLENFEQELATQYPALEMDFDELITEEENSTEDTSVEEPFTNFVMHYYTDNNGSFAWEFYPDNEADSPVIFISTAKGFCLYGGEEGTPEVIFYSVATSDKTGTFYLPSDEEEANDLTIEYELGDNAFSMHMLDEALELTMEFAFRNNTMTVNYELVAEGMSILMDMTSTATTSDMSMTVASYGMKLGSLDMKTTLRDYVAPVVPQNTTDIDTWTNSLDQDTLTNDLLELMTKYPSLMKLIMGIGDTSGEEVAPQSTYTPDENYTDAFMNMTGYSITEDGFVDFSPTEEEVLAAGKPSTGYNSIAVSETQKQKLLDYCANLFESCYYEAENYYSVWGSPEYNDVASYYATEHYYNDNNDNNSFIFLDFDAVSGDFISVVIYTGSEEKSVQALNDILSILGVDVKYNVGEVPDSQSIGDFLISGYEDGSYYGVSIEAYYE